MAWGIKFDSVGLTSSKPGLKNFLYLRFCSEVLSSMHTNSGLEGMERNGSRVQANEPVGQ